MGSRAATSSWFSYSIVVVDVTDSDCISEPRRGSLVRRAVARRRCCLRRQSVDVASGDRRRDARIFDLLNVYKKTTDLYENKEFVLTTRSLEENSRIMVL